MVDKAEEVAKAPEPEESERCDFPCESCGARMLWDPDADALSCDFCGQKYRFDAVDAARIFLAGADQPPVSSSMQ